MRKVSTIRVFICECMTNNLQSFFFCFFVFLSRFSAKQFRIGYGHINAREVIRLTATSALIHSHFNGKTLENDLAIITLPQNQLINVQIVTPIAISRMAVPLNQNGTVASFGFENDTSNAISEHLMVARQVVIDNQACADAFGRPVHAHQFCGQDRPTVEAPPVEDEEDDGGDDEGDASGEDGDAGGEDGDGTGSNEEGENDGTGEGNSNEGENDQAQGGGDWTNGWSRRSMGRVSTNDNEQSTVCRGDTGSAIIRRTDKGIVGFGIVSRIPQGCNADRPALYTRLPAFTQWLEDATLGEVRIVDY